MEVKEVTALVPCKREIRVQPVRAGLVDLFSNKSGKQLLELINLGLRKSTLQQIVKAVEAEEPLDTIHPQSAEANAYLAKILREEIQKQFKESKRPLIELILNGVDARPKDHLGPYTVDISATHLPFVGGTCTVTDNGKGMSLDRILDTLIIPFSSDKDELVDIGRFGVGFFSVLQYCLKEPSTKVTVTSGSLQNAYELQIYSIGEKVEDLQCTLRKVNISSEGTSVKVSGLDKELIKGTEEYVSKYLRHFDSNRAILKFNRHQVNTALNSPERKQYTQDIIMQYRGSPVKQPLRVCLDSYTRFEPGMFLLSQGVLVENYEGQFGRLEIDLPSAVSLVEGRDEIRKDENYDKCIEASLNAIEKYLEDHNHDIRVLNDLRELLPPFGRYMCTYSAMDVTEFEKRFVKLLFPDEVYLLSDLEGVFTQNLVDFMGEGVRGLIYTPRTNEACKVWCNYLPTGKDLVEDYGEVLGHAYSSEGIRSVLGYESPMEELLGNMSHVTLIKMPIQGVSPIVTVNQTTFVNVDHELFEEANWVNAYAVRTAYLRNSIGEFEMEAHTI